jgi:secretion/DNA translocation related TadE-like protein
MVTAAAVRAAVHDDDRGVGTVLGVMLGAILLAAGVVAGALVSVSVGHQRASVAADLAALAAASHGCDAAEAVARAQGAVGVTCSAEGADAVVTVALPPPVMLQRIAAWTGHEAPAIASSARAGRASPPAPPA